MNDTDITIATEEDLAALPAGTWLRDAEGDIVCIFDTHMGFPQRMVKEAHSNVLHNTSHLKLPAKVMDLVEKDGYVCQHRRTNECGQCYRCGKPETGEHREMVFDLIDGMPFASQEETPEAHRG